MFGRSQDGLGGFRGLGDGKVVTLDHWACLARLFKSLNGSISLSLFLLVWPL